ncbi:hypothetical protein [Glutamicibacter sp. X7]
MTQSPDYWHVYPINDQIHHDTESDECICGPTVSLVKTDDGDRWIYTHHSLDGRESNE